MGNEYDVSALRIGPNYWNRRREKISPRNIDLSNEDLSRTSLAHANLAKANLRRTNLEASSLFGAKLQCSDLSEAILIRTNLCEANLSGSNLSNANLSGSDLREADLSGVNLSWANLSGANLSETNLDGADLRGAHLFKANLSGSNLINANLSETNLSEANLERAIIKDCRIYAISAWKVNLKNATQRDLVITPSIETTITVDNLMMAQFIYLLLHNENIRHVIDTITSKVVLILGRFTPERMAVLDAIKEELRKRDYLPVLFKFDGPENQDVTETVSTLAHMARFVIADITDAKSVSAELEHIVPQLPSVAVQPIIMLSDEEYGMFKHIQRYHWVLPLYRYKNQNELIEFLEEKIIDPAESKANDIRRN
jgi:uncharacterized protein YjbI with pentapeptide repeats